MNKHEQRVADAAVAHEAACKMTQKSRSWCAGKRLGGGLVRQFESEEERARMALREAVILAEANGARCV